MKQEKQKKKKKHNKCKIKAQQDLIVKKKQNKVITRKCTQN
jgi:hypothetical protein